MCSFLRPFPTAKSFGGENKGKKNAFHCNQIGFCQGQGKVEVNSSTYFNYSLFKTGVQVVFSDAAHAMLFNYYRFLPKYFRAEALRLNFNSTQKLIL